MTNLVPRPMVSGRNSPHSLTIMKFDAKLSQRLSLLTLTSWMSVCLLISGFFPDATLHLQKLWALTGCMGLVASFGLVHKIKNELLAQAELINSMQNEAETDALTSLANRRVLERQLSACVAERQSGGRPFMFSLIDIDHFKSINDTHGHQTGDRILRFIGNMLKVTMGEDALVARYGGDEFAVIMPTADADVMLTKLNRVRSRISHDSRYSDDLEPTSISMGLALAETDDDEISVFAKADKALYQAKHEGRDRTILYDDRVKLNRHTVETREEVTSDEY